MNNTTVNYTPALSITSAPAAIKQVATQNATTSSKAEPLAAAPVAQADRTRLSLASSLVSKTLSLPDVRNEKVASLQKAIDEGTYKVSSHDVAGKLLKSLLG